MTAPRLGPKQLRHLTMVGANRALVVSDRTSRRLCDLGLMREMIPGGAVCITPAGLRALADAAEAGRVDLFTLPERKP